MSLVISDEGIRILDSLRDEKGWNRYDPEWYKAAEVSEATAGRIWGKKPVRRENSIRFCRVVGADWRQVIDRNLSSNVDWLPIKINWDRVTDTPTLYGREEELLDLEQKLVAERYRVIALSGFPGIGKSVLTLKLAEKVQLQFDYLIYLPLESRLSLEEVLNDTLKKIHNRNNTNSNKNFSPHIRSTSDLLSQLMDFLRKYRCLLVLENYERILRSDNYAGSYQDRYRSFHELIQRMGSQQHESCLLVTCCELSEDILQLKARDLRVYSLPLKELSEDACCEILRAKGLSESERHYWRKLVQNYGGNPLFLKIIAEYIKERHNGRVEEFLKSGTTFVRNIDKIIAELYDRLSALEKKVMCRLASQEEPVWFDQIQEFFSSCPGSLDKAIDSLINRSLIEKKGDGFGLPQIVRKYIISSLESDPERELECELLHQS